MACRFAPVLCLFALTGCRILSGEVTCRLDRDCPDGIARCAGAVDGGAGLCEPVPDGGLDAGLDAGLDGGSHPDGGGDGFVFSDAGGSGGDASSGPTGPGG